MPEIKPQDFTPQELTQAADVCRGATKLLDPAAAELNRVVEDLRPDRPDDALFYARTSRYLLGASFHLTGAAIDLREIAVNVGRTYKSVSTLLNRIGTIASLVWPPMLLSGLVLPEHIAHIIADEARLPAGFAVGIAAANWILYRRTRHPRPHSERHS